MRLHRFFVGGDLRDGEEIRISDQSIIHQIKDVFRLESGDMAVFFDGKGIDYICKIDSISKKEMVVIKEREEKAFIPEKKVTLLMPIIKKENFELVCEKATELGVSKIIPIITERTLIKNLNIERLVKIVREASEQCGRGDVPQIGETTDLDKALNTYQNIIVFDASGSPFEGSTSVARRDVESTSSASLRSAPPSREEFEILIGPEGGWTERELNLFKESYIPIYKLGETILRAETAAIVALGSVLID